jgi:hypothetical protein
MNSGPNMRGTVPPVPANVKRLLTVEQTIALKQLESFGWRIAFVRRPLFQQVVVVVTSYDGKEMGVLELDGELNLSPSITLREPAEQSEMKDQLHAAK